MFISDCPHCGRREIAGYTQVQRTSNDNGRVRVDLRCRCGAVHTLQAGRRRPAPVLAA